MNRKSALAFSLAPIVVSAIGFVFTPLLSWWLAEDDMARFAMFQTNANFFALIVSLGLDQALAREFHETNSPGRLLNKVLQLVLLSIPVGVLGLGIIKLNADGPVSASVTLGMALACVLMLLNRIYSSYIRMSGNGVAYAIDIATPKVFQLSLIALLGSQSLVVITYDVVVGIFVASAAAALCFEIFMAGRIGRSFGPGSGAIGAKPPPRYAELLKFGAPLVPGALAYYGISASAIYIVSVYGTSREVVTTSLAISVGGGLAVLQSVFSTLWTPFAYRWHARNGSPALYGYIATVVTMACSVLLLASLFVAPYLSILFPEKYAGLPDLLVLVIVWNLLYLVSIVGSFGIGIKRMSFTSMTISLVGALLSIGMSIIATRHFGAQGALLAVLAAFIVTLVLNCEFSARRWTRVVGLHHYLMVAVMTTAGIIFSLGCDWQAKLLLAASIIFYLPIFKAGLTQTYAIHKNPGK
jgi:O-antigen/teichoic acid export membrane protein